MEPEETVDVPQSGEGAEETLNDFELESSIRFNAAAFGMMVASGGVLAAGAFFDREGRSRMMEASFAKGTWYPDWEGIDPEPADEPPQRVEPDPASGGLRLAEGSEPAAAGELLFSERPVFSIRGLRLAVVGATDAQSAARDPCHLAAQLLADWRPSAHLFRVLPAGKPEEDPAAEEASGWARSSAHRPADRRRICRALRASLSASRIHPGVRPADVACHALAPRILLPDGPEPNVRLVALCGADLVVRAEALRAIAPGERLVASRVEEEVPEGEAERALAEAVAKISIDGGGVPPPLTPLRD